MTELNTDGADNLIETEVGIKVQKTHGLQIAIYMGISINVDTADTPKYPKTDGLEWKTLFKWMI